MAFLKGKKKLLVLRMEVESADNAVPKVLKYASKCTVRGKYNFYIPKYNFCHQIMLTGARVNIVIVIRVSSSLTNEI